MHKERDCMKKLILVSLLSFTAMNVTAKCTEAIANTTMGKITLHCLKITGVVNLNGTTIQKNLDLIGSLNATSAHLNQLNSKGDVILHQTIVSGKTNIQGKLEATNTIFANSIQLTTTSATFYHSTLENLQVTAQKTAYVYLNQSTVNGNINFTQGHGVVKNNHSTIKGKIIGGKIEE